VARTLLMASLQRALAEAERSEANDDSGPLGYMEGAVKSGERAAMELLRAKSPS
jgi:hypothetical protein